MSESPARFERAFILENLAETVRLGTVLAAAMDSPGALALFGGLGSGKTTLIQAVGKALGVGEPITSPTYTLINRYEDGCRPLVHVDCYRLDSAEDLEGIGLPEVLSGSEIVCMEWSERARGILPRRRLELELGWLDPTRRSVRLRCFGELWPGLERGLDAWLDGKDKQ
ncbi:tRNA (adenosine(37)-N6)-threonylcarbamoyltransferase complex ATPase subunit type 1 TsaE [bacterium]|nr:tRNA (adenosine(37)-N6)-threonylcarbamoyltransferase complex ATPase subunit type 1 TsaE [bacterium]